MKMLLAGSWVDRPEKIDVQNPFDQSVVDTVPRATPSDVEAAVAAAVEGAKQMRRLTGHERYHILHKAAELMRARQADLGRTISLEEGKIIGEGNFEASRSIETIELSAEEAKRLGGEVLPLDGAPGGAGKFGFTIRVPCSVVVAITPFNFPLNLVCHKVGPALAAGNAVIIKPASDTPLSALKLVEILLESGVPPLAVQCLTGSGSQIGDALCRDPRVRKITFTGSRDVGEHICKTAGIKRVTMELGSNSPVIVMDDADLEKVAASTAVTGYTNAGQVCISTQRVLVLDRVYGDLVDALAPKVRAIRTGDQLKPETKMGPMIRENDAKRVLDWIDEAVRGGAKLLAGGSRKGSLVEPALLGDVNPRMRVSCDELFGPAVALTRCKSIDEAIALANDTRYGLSAAIFTRSLNNAIRFARECESGNIHINWGTQWRADLMPYGGLKESGLGKEGPKYAVQEMTELKTVVMHDV
ncbi:MAG: aldehyde dehydrogenase family protein [Planctomycetia bacterium]|nr:aldehyde dehydrogenase family protein [Planctomycetia bacterium]